MKIKICLFFLVIVFSKAILAQNKECVYCHSDRKIIDKSKDKNANLFVNGGLFEKSVHGDLDCVDCHEGFNIKDASHKSSGNISKVDCGNCHEDITGSFKTSIHRRIKPNKGKIAPNCVTCHGSHYVKYPEDIKNKRKYYCVKCHGNVEYKSNFHEEKYFSDKYCGECHESEDERILLKKSVHATLACSDCHKIEANNIEQHQDGVNGLKIASCSMCHKREARQHKESIHGISLAEGVEEAAKCWDCHGSHGIKNIKNKTSPVYMQNIPNTCAHCHSNPKLMQKYPNAAYLPVKEYKESIHGKLLANGKQGVANCTSCHGVHNIKNILQSRSKISPYNLPNTCKRCHPKAVANYKKSIHWVYVKMGVKLSPVCNDCHSEHSIISLSGKSNREAVKAMENETCVTCHSNKLLGKRFGLQGTQPHSYLDSYHGMAAVRGDNRVALCTDCHNTHNILPKRNMYSSVNQKNVKRTCAKCHKNATQIFSESYSHVAFTKSGNKIENLVKNIYFWLIVVVIGGMVFHNLLILFFEIRKKKKHIKRMVSVSRFSTNEVIQHYLLFISFIVLALTGFTIKYSSTWWSLDLMNLGITEPVRQIIHRTAAVIMIVIGLYHILYLLVAKRGRNIFIAMLPKFKDITDFFQNLFYYLGIGKQKPLFDKYDYTEKAEYWALIWGTIVMGLTGLILWFPTIVGNWAPSWLIKVSEIIHFYEAILATLAIVVWHWFFVIFHPEQYPMNVTWIDGKMSLTEYFHHHKYNMYKIIIEWYKLKNDLVNVGALSYDTQQLLKSLGKQKINIEEMFSGFIENDGQLKSILKKIKNGDQYSDVRSE